ncbi:MAG: hypothetical protein RSG50_10045, partial [Clostridia bacterium]
MKYAIIKKHTGKRRLSAACRLLNVRRRYCAWAAREQERPVRVRRDEALTRTDEGWLYLCTCRMAVFVRAIAYEKAAFSSTRQARSKRHAQIS